VAKTYPEDRAVRFIETEEEAGCIITDPEGVVVWPPSEAPAKEENEEDE
jgi:hypothetical protein